MLDVICPVKNEIDSILNTINVLSEKSDEIRCLFIDGNSSDGTYEVLERECSKYDTFDVLEQEDLSTGKGGAVRQGIESSSNDIIVIIDGDIETIRSEWIDLLVEPIREERALFTKASYDYKGEDFVTENIAIPLLEELFPEVQFTRPIEGEVALSRSVLDKVEIGDGFALESYLSIDVVMQDVEYEEVFLGEKVHACRKGSALVELSKEVQEAILNKGIQYKRI